MAVDPRLRAERRFEFALGLDLDSDLPRLDTIRDVNEYHRVKRIIESKRKRLMYRIKKPIAWFIVNQSTHEMMSLSLEEYDARMFLRDSGQFPHYDEVYRPDTF